MRIRFLVTVVLVFVFLHLCGASAQVVPPGVATWYLGPCTLQRPVDGDRFSLACFQHDIAQIGPLIGSQSVQATR